MVEIRKLKEEFSAGFWNANSVLIGGLGKYPDITGSYLTYFLHYNCHELYNCDKELGGGGVILGKQLTLTVDLVRPHKKNYLFSVHPFQFFQVGREGGFFF